MSSFEYWRFLDLFSSSVKQEYALWRSFFPLQHYEAFNLELNRKRRRNFFFLENFFSRRLKLNLFCLVQNFKQTTEQF